MPSHPAEFTRALPEEAATQALGAALAPALTPGMVIYLRGELGAGKTTLARGLLRGLGYQGRVKSPSFALVEVYEISRLYLYHFDFYRFIESKNPQAFRQTGFAEHFNQESVCIVEWPERVGGLPAADLTVTLEVVAKDGFGRTARLHADSETGAKCLNRLITRNPAGVNSTP
jgi:tRNA threonylcarbamoyladenosine biosynthesis protein TsaE